MRKTAKTCYPTGGLRVKLQIHIAVYLIDPSYPPPYDRVVDHQTQPRLSTKILDTGRAFIEGIRPKQWTKNLIVFFPLFFTISESSVPSDAGLWLSLIGKVLLAFLFFSVLTGAVYLINDVFDVEKDRQHPKKRLRPVASGRLGTSQALIAALVLMSIALAFSFLLSIPFGSIAAGYLALMLVYTLWVKQFVLLDVFSISAGFVLRAVAGAAVIQVPISPWLYICTGLGALLIALGKRRSEIDNAGSSAPAQRGSLETYSQTLIDQFIAIVAPSTLLAYTLYTFTAPNLPRNHAMMLTIPFVLYGLFRYLYLVHTHNAGETPEELLITDRPLLASIILWLATAAAILLVFRS